MHTISDEILPNVYWDRCKIWNLYWCKIYVLCLFDDDREYVYYAGVLVMETIAFVSNNSSNYDLIQYPYYVLSSTYSNSDILNYLSHLLGS